VKIYIESNAAQQGLTLLEIMVSTAILLVIVLGLTAMFHETQRAFVTGVNQVDTLGGARSAMEMVVSDLEQVRLKPPQDPLTIGFAVTNGLPLLSSALSTLDLQGAKTPYLQEVYFTHKAGNRWEGSAYWISDNTSNGVGALYRFSTNSAENAADLLHDKYLNAKVASSTKIMDGVVYFKVTPYNSDGRPFTNDVARTGQVVKENLGLFYAGNSSTNLPFFIQLELGVLEPPVLAKLNQFKGNAVAQHDFLLSQASKVHMFRQLIPIRTASR
jgi:prepilin-type N-terminal cleavage/methylation domain-containing protein